MSNLASTITIFSLFCLSSITQAEVIYNIDLFFPAHNQIPGNDVRVNGTITLDSTGTFLNSDLETNVLDWTINFSNPGGTAAPSTFSKSSPLAEFTAFGLAEATESQLVFDLSLENQVFEFIQYNPAGGQVPKFLAIAHLVNDTGSFYYAQYLDQNDQLIFGSQAYQNRVVFATVPEPTGILLLAFAIAVFSSRRRKLVIQRQVSAHESHGLLCGLPSGYHSR